jgi:hypothetical protein
MNKIDIYERKLLQKMIDEGDLEGLVMWIEWMFEEVYNDGEEAGINRGV